MATWNNKLTKLRNILVDLYPNKEDGRLIVDMSGIPKGIVAFNGKSNINWLNILTEANKHNKVQNIVQIASDEFPEIDELKSLYREVESKDSFNSIRNLSLEFNFDDIANTKSKKFIQTIASIKEVTKKHDLLVPNIKGLEKVVGEDDLVDITWLSNALNISKSICKIETEDGESGTGFLLNGGFLITNNHVINSAKVADSTRIVFNYMTDKDNNVMDHTYYELDSSVFLSSPENELDFTIVKVNDNKSTPLSEWGSVELESFYNPKIGQRVTIIQHPNGYYKKMALPDAIISTWKNYLFYKTDTQEGSSGAPVFNKNWKVVALHHAGKIENGGFQINDEGQFQSSNRGILIKKILENLKDRNFNHNF